MVRGRKVRTTRSDASAPREPDLVDRNWDVAAPNRVWATDFTYVATWSGIAYVAFVIDVFSRRIVGWRVAANMRTELVLDALEHGIWARDDRLDGLICHSDRGVQAGFNWSSQNPSWRCSMVVDSKQQIERFGRS